MLAPDAAELLLPEGSHLIHLGPSKTGTTSIQNALRANADELLRHGVVYPGDDAKAESAVTAMLDAAKMAPRFVAQRERFDADLAAADGRRVCISNELLARSKSAQAERLVAAWGGERPHILMAVRRFDRYLPSEWQQNVKQNEALGYGDYLELVLRGGAPSTDERWHSAWESHQTHRVVERWAAAAGGLENVTVMVVSESDRGRLTTIFETMLGLPAGTLDEAPRNRSLSYQETELIRLWRKEFSRNDASRTDQHRFVRRAGWRLMAQPQSPNAAKMPPLPLTYRAEVQEFTEQRIAGLKRLQAQGLRIVGDLEELRVPDSAFVDGEASDLATFEAEDVQRLLQGIAEAIKVEDRTTRREQRKKVKQLQRQIKRLKQRLANRPATPTPGPLARVGGRLDRGLAKLRRS